MPRSSTRPDVLVKITTTDICGSDLHMYEGRTDLEPGMVLGHENMGVVAEVGSAVAKPSWIVSHQLPLDEALSGYQHYDARDNGWTKVVLHP
jgi:threonine dehydrogenase-like Zn-dependent dehydrogenase